MKTTETKIPNLDSLVSGLNDKPEVEQILKVESVQTAEEPVQPTITEDNSTLWEELMYMLEHTKEKAPDTSQKIYKVDSDIVETIALCKFKNHTITHVINCILRTYIIANIRNFDSLRRHEPSLFDNYLTK